MKVLCITHQGTSSELLANGIYVVEESLSTTYRLRGLRGFYAKSRFKVIEEPQLDNSLGDKTLDQHNEKPVPPEAREDS